MSGWRAAPGTAAGLVHATATCDTAGQLPGILGAAVLQLPAVWVLSTLTLALFGTLPRLTTTTAAWGALARCFVLGQFGRALTFDQSVLGISPFTHIPQVPGGDLTVAPLARLMAIAVPLTACGLATGRRRGRPRGGRRHSGRGCRRARDGACPAPPREPAPGGLPDG